MQPTVADITLKDKIHFAISDIEDEKILESIYTLINYTNSQKENSTVDNEQFLILKEREANYLAGQQKGFTPEEIDLKIKGKYGF